MSVVRWASDVVRWVPGAGRRTPYVATSESVSASIVNIFHAAVSSRDVCVDNARVLTIHCTYATLVASEYSIDCPCRRCRKAQPQEGIDVPGPTIVADRFVWRM